MATKLKDPNRVVAGISPKKFLHHFNEIRNAKFKQDQAVGVTRNLRKQAKADGVNLDALAMMERLANLPPDEAKDLLQQFGFYSTVTNQEYADLPLWAAAGHGVASEKLLTQQALEDAEHAGRLVGCKGGAKSDNPHNPGSEFHVRWDSGFNDGYEFFEQRPAIEKKVTAASGRGRGRPPGAKNKPKGHGIPLAAAPTLSAPATVQ
jgi:hypothetical protein